eukprot:10447973-Alexandrium_andersonii.AAC.1
MCIRDRCSGDAFALGAGKRFGALKVSRSGSSSLAPGRAVSPLGKLGQLHCECCACVVAVLPLADC